MCIYLCDKVKLNNDTKIRIKPHRILKTGFLDKKTPKKLMITNKNASITITLLKLQCLHSYFQRAKTHIDSKIDHTSNK